MIFKPWEMNEVYGESQIVYVTFARACYNKAFTLGEAVIVREYDEDSKTYVVEHMSVASEDVILGSDLSAVNMVPLEMAWDAS